MIEHAKALINEYCLREFDSEANFENLSAIPVAYTTIEDELFEVQAYVNLIDFKIVKRITHISTGEKAFEEIVYENLEQFIEYDLLYLEFSDLIYVDINFYFGEEYQQ